ncbi:MAG TPA: FHA domain-containing protein, partial [Woeseiaceae bacterium]|nr:FHA domain-containing protein [Woeseiaceae bacterium]
LTELANKPHAQAPASGAEPVIHRLTDRNADTPAAEGQPAVQEKERTARLLIGTVDGQEVRFPLFKNKLTIGRTAHNDIQLKAQYISRRHAVVVCENDSTRIVDWGSKNGIYVNGTRVSEKILKNGDQLTVGTAEFRFEERPKR